MKNSQGHELQEQYKTNLKNLEKAGSEIFSEIKQLFKDEKYIDQIKFRAKSADSFYKKAIQKKNGKFKYSYPLEDIQDQIAFRIVVRYKSNINPTKKLLLKEYREIENKYRQEPNEKSFGYEGHHMVCLIPSKIKKKYKLLIKFFEIQICTLFQHAWAEAEHDIGYKYGKIPNKDTKRELAWMAAQAWGADKIFEKLKKIKF